ncbi:hypothetical protein FE697_006035 [Mumia zhuanghuii]|uniref:Uncharacterized protein n=2 Tax=Mumia TaxID=1546255 RepID=A0ABW1QJZ7_9ACTN|nr:MULTISPECIES: hypothetical protein [Mumia]KAA1425408.1 hypothetical protein FE697_006035 [Mumia zhuanghuii]
MAVLNYVWFWPNGGPVGRPWGDGGDVTEDAFARTSRRVTERYSEALGSFDIQARRSAVQMFVSPADTASSVVVDVHLTPVGDETVRAHVPTQVATFSSQDRARVVLEVVDASMRAIGAARGWPLQALEQAKQHVLDHHMGFEMTGAWKMDRARRLRARPVARVADDGWSELCFEVAPARAEGSLGFTQALKSPSNSLPKFKRGAATEFRWASESTIERPDDWQPRYGKAWGPVEVFETSNLHAWPIKLDPVPAHSPLPVELRSR